MRIITLSIIGILLFTAIITSGICYTNYIERNKPYVYTAQEIFSNECSRKGGNVQTKEGWDDTIYIQEYKCEVK